MDARLLGSGGLVPLCLLLLLSVTSTRGYSGGAGEPACSTLMPGHGVQSKDIMTSPYQVELSQTSYEPGETIEVNITGTAEFKGFLLMARHASDARDPVGTFSVIDGTRLACESKSDGNALTHSSNNPKSHLSVTWTAPDPPDGPVKFWFTVVQAFENIWVGMQTQTVSGEGEPPEKNIEEQEKIDDFDTSSCGKTKSCVTGDYFVSWQYTEGQGIKFEMSGNFAGYLALGFSLDDRMGEDSVVACAKDQDGVVSVYNSYNDGRTNKAITDISLGLSQIEAWSGGDVIRCTFVRAESDTGEDQFFDLTSTKYHLLLATGPSSGGFIQQHSSIPVPTSDKLDMTKNDINLVVKKDFLMIKLHACFMLTAWVLSASTGILLARYYRDAWADREIFKKPVWFQVHRTCMITTFCLHIAGFVIIFLEIGDFTEVDDPKYLKAHPLMGIILTGLVIMNPVMALFRCHPGTPNRPYFNWAHWFVGNTAHIVAVVVIILGMQFPKSQEFIDDWLVWLMVAFVVFHVMTELVLEISRRSSKSTTGGRDITFGKQGSEDSELRYYLLPSYFLVVIGLLAAMIAIIALG